MKVLLRPKFLKLFLSMKIIFSEICIKKILVIVSYIWFVLLTIFNFAYSPTVGKFTWIKNLLHYTKFVMLKYTYSKTLMKNNLRYNSKNLQDLIVMLQNEIFSVSYNSTLYPFLYIIQRYTGTFLLDQDIIFIYIY